jgi:hypothetical protein
MNSGIQNAYNLARKLALVVQAPRLRRCSTIAMPNAARLGPNSSPARAPPAKDMVASDFPIRPGGHIGWRGRPGADPKTYFDRVFSSGPAA